MIEARHLRREFGSIVAVDDVSLTVPEGTILALLGPNGAGKTTTVRLLAGLLAPTAGEASGCLVDVMRGPDPDPLACGLPALDRLAGADLGALGLGRLDVRDQASLGEQEAGPRLEQRHRVRRQLEAGEPAPQLDAAQDLVGQSVLLRGAPRALEDGAAGRAGVDASREVEQALARAPLQLVPQLVGPAKQRHVGRVLGVDQPDHTRDPVRGPHLVGDVETLQAQDALAPPRQVVGDGAPHASDAGDDDVEAPGQDPRGRRGRFM